LQSVFEFRPARLASDQGISVVPGIEGIVMQPRTTIVVSPRERYSPTIESLTSLFQSIPPGVPVVVVDGAFPAALRAELQALAQTRPFHHETRSRPLLPNEARNIGIGLVETEFVVFTDNDVLYQPGWLEALEAHADRAGVEVVVPVTCIGPPAAKIIHQAGGVIYANRDKRGVRLKEVHNLSKRPIEELKTANLPETTDTGEFHCIFARAAFVRRIGPLDERLITREHNDFALRTRHAGGRIGFEPNSVVTYNAMTRMQPGDLSYLVFRWNHRDAVKSLDAFQQVWGVTLHRRKILRGIRNRRRYRIIEELAHIRRVTGSLFVKYVVAPFVERRIMRDAQIPADRQLPRRISPEERRAVIATLAPRT
jgi:GT2 family glycosyltransferase